MNAVTLSALASLALAVAHSLCSGRSVRSGRGRAVARSVLLALRINLTWRRTSARVGLVQLRNADDGRLVAVAGKQRPKKPRYLRPKLWALGDEYGVVVQVRTVGQLGLAEWQAAAPYLANAWRCVRVSVSQTKPGHLLVRAMRRDPLTERTTLVPTGEVPVSLDERATGRDEWGNEVSVRSSGVSGVVVAGLAGFGKTSLINRWFCALAPSPAVQFVLLDGKGGPDYDDVVRRCWLSGKDSLTNAKDALSKVHQLMMDRQNSIRAVLGVKNVWHVGPSSTWPLIVVIIDEAHTFFAEYKGNDKASKDRASLAAECARFVEELIRKGRNVGIQVILATQKATGDAIPTRIRDNCQVALSFAQRTNEAAVAALGSDINEYPDAHPRNLQDPAYIGVASMVLDGHPGFSRVRMPYVQDEYADRIAADTAHLVTNPLELLHGQLVALGIAPDADEYMAPAA